MEIVSQRFQVDAVGEIVRIFDNYVRHVPLGLPEQQFLTRRVDTYTAHS